MLRDRHLLRRGARTCVVLIATVIAVAGCGIKGPLRPAPTVPVQPSAAPAPAPAPNAPAPAQEPPPPAPPRS